MARASPWGATCSTEALSDRGFVTRRETREGTVFDVQIYRDVRGHFLLGVRQDETTPLDGFANR